MASSEVVNLIIELVSDMLVYLLPVIAVLSGITFIVSFLMNVVMGFARRSTSA